MAYKAQDLSEMWSINHQKQKEYAKTKSYIKGKNAKIMQSPARNYPDNKIPIPLAKIAVDDLSGYAGKKGLTTFTWKLRNVQEDEATKKQLNARDEYAELMKKIYDHNNADLLGAQLYEEALPQGVAYELYYTSDELKLKSGMLTPEFAMVRRSNMEIVWTDDLKPKKTEARHYVTLSNKTKQISIYYPEYAEIYQQTNKGWELVDEYAHVYTKVPVAEYKINLDRESLYMAEKRIIDSVDSVISKSTNEVDRFNALIMLLPRMANKELMDKLSELRVFDDLGDLSGDQWPRYLQKDLTGVSDFYKTIYDTLTEVFHKSTKVPDFSDEKFGGNQSGVAMAYKILGLEFRASQVESYFNQGYYQRDELIQDVIRESSMKLDPDDYTMEVDNKRNLPVDEEAKARIVEMLIGILSEETLLKILPQSIVKDAKAEVERKKKEAAERQGNIIVDEEEGDEEE